MWDVGRWNADTIDIGGGECSWYRYDFGSLDRRRQNRPTKDRERKRGEV